MYARLVMFNIGQGKRPVAEKMADQFLSVMHELAGFKEVAFLVNEAEGEYGALSLWASKQDAESAGEAMTVGLRQALEGLAQEAPIQRMFEVYEPVPVA